MVGAVRALHQVAREQRRQRACGRECRANQIAGRENVGLHHVVVGRRSLGAVAGDLVIRASAGIHRLHRTDSDHVRIIAGRRDGAVAIAAVHAQTSVVTSRHNHRDACLPSLFHRLTERIGCVGGIDWTTQRQVDDLDVVGGLERNCTLNRGDHVAVRTDPILVQNAKVNKIHTVGNSGELSVGIRTVARKDTCHMCTVAVGVIDGVAGCVLDARTGEILVIENARLSNRIPQVVVVIVDSAVDNRNANSHAPGAKTLSARGSDVDGCVGQVVGGLQFMVG